MLHLCCYILVTADHVNKTSNQGLHGCFMRSMG